MRRPLAAGFVVACALTSSHCGSSDAGPAPARTCAITRPAPADTHLRADGTVLRDALGRIVTLHGVNAGGRSKTAPFVPFDVGPDGFDAALAKYMDRASAWGIDVLRVPFTWAAVEPTQGADDAAYLARYDAILDAAWARGMWTVVDFHQDVYSENFCGDGFPPWTIPDPKPAFHHDCSPWGAGYLNDQGVRKAFDAFWAEGGSVQAAYLALWDRVAARHEDRPGVIGFEPINEPGWGTQDPGVFSATTLTAFYTRVVPRLRAIAPNALVFVDPIGSDGLFVTTQLGRPAGDGVVFAPHFYPVGALEADTILDAMRKWQAVGAAWGTPTFVGEFGAGSEDETGAERMKWTFDALDAAGLHGTQWEYSASDQIWNDEHFDVARGDGSETPLAASLVRAYPRALAGKDATWSWDAQKRKLTLRYTPAEGVTEIALPARAVPNGFTMTLSGGCYDATTSGLVMVRADPGAPDVTVTIDAR